MSVVPGIGGDSGLLKPVGTRESRRVTAYPLDLRKFRVSL